MKALGLLCVCLSLDPKTWTFSIRGLDAICKDGRTAIIHALDELEDLGYLHRSRVQERKEDGGFGHTHYVFYDKPHPKDAPCTRFMYTDDPHTENLPQEKTKLETKKLETPQKPPRGRTAKAAPDYEPEIFGRFWTAYLIGRDKQGAIREWDRLKPSRQLMQTMAAALAEQKKTLSAEDPHDRYPFPYAIRWIRDRRWEDDLGKRPHSAPPDAGRTVEAPPGVAVW
ncbi:MAG: hypothetical protein IKD61_01285 [Oscillospiraceae bacterium]|nr:hypothetical protein [Oscillospiraceae bacterium]